MTAIEKSIRVEVPVRTAYNQWTQFEEFPRFMDGIDEVRQLDDARLFWSAHVAGQHKEWYARITRQVPDQVVVWESEGGAFNNGIVSFKPAGSTNTEVQLHLEYQPDDFKEEIGGVLGFLSRRVEGDLKRFKDYIERRGHESGAWRGEIEHARVVDEPGLYGSTGQGGANYGGTPYGEGYPGTPGTPARPL